MMRDFFAIQSQRHYNTCDIQNVGVFQICVGIWSVTLDVLVTWISWVYPGDQVNGTFSVQT